MSKESARESARLAMKDLFGGGEETAEAAEPKGVVPGKKMEPAAPARTRETTVIGDGTNIVGTVDTPNAMEIYGFVKGDVTSADDIHLYGRVLGNVKCRNFYQYSGAVKGDVEATENIQIEKDGAVLGNLKSTVFVSDGKVSGDIVATHNVDLLPNAVVLGNVNTGYFVMKDSACLKGVVKLNCNDDATNAAFEDCFNF